MNASLKKSIARILVLCMVNPALFMPSAWARDTEVYSGFLADSSTTIKPNILLLLDTSDSMNLPEGWREYAGAYDSHVEYLWNDLSRIVDADVGSAGEVTTEDSNRISTAATPATFFSKWGFWAGDTLAARQAIWQAARTSAQATEPGDPGARSQWRLYDDLSWIYWLPAGTAETDARLRSPSWNKFRGYIQELGNGLGGSQLRGGPTYADTNDYRNLNQCSASLTALTPSTVFVPSAVAANDGKYLGQQWARWEPYLNLTTVGNSGYPGSSTLFAALGGTDQYPSGYVNTATASTGNPANNLVYRDSYPKAIPSATPPSIGATGLPIRYDSGTAGAGWDQLKADAGGFVLQSIIGSYSSRTDLEQVMSWYLLPATTDVNGSGTTDLSDAQFIAWKGNRDGSPVFGSMTGVPAYMDITTAACDSATGPTNGNATCLDKPGASSIPNETVSKTATCALTGQTPEIDAAGSTRLRGGTCTISSGPTCTGDTNGAAYPNCTDVANPVCPAEATTNASFVSTAYSGCAPGGLVTLSTATTCAFAGYLTTGACSVAAPSTVSVAACAMSGQTSVNVGNCAWSGQQTKTIGSCAWSGRTAYYTEGVGWRANGGTCQESGSTANCTSTTDSTVYSTSAAAIAATGSCTNAVASGSYNYGGTCTENSSSSSCAITGGTSVLGAGYTNVNAQCGNSLPVGTYKYGGSCTENGSASSCNAASGGTSLNIRGNAQTYNQVCSGNKVNSGSTKNATGSYTYGGTCAASQNYNTCTAGTAASFTVRGTAYTPTTCTAVVPTGYHRAGACAGTNVPCTTVTPYGGTTVSDGTNNWYSTLPTCTPHTSAVSYYSTCLGTSKVIPSVGGTAVTTSNTITACNYTTHVAPDSNTAYDTCTNKTNISTTCSARYGMNCAAATPCANPAATSVTGGAVSAVHNFYRTYNFSSKTDNLVHDCKADEPAANPGGNSYMRNIPGSLAPVGTPFPSLPLSGTSISTSIASNVAPYTTSTSQAVAADASKNVDMYSVNYLNWKFGPKGPTGSPIGRKTRLQVAKDVLTQVVGSINGVRIGLMSFNQMDNTAAANSSGAHLDMAITDLDATTRVSLINAINALLASSATPLTESVFESYRYFKGLSPLFGGATYQAQQSRFSTAGNLRYVTEGIDLSTNAVQNSLYKSPIQQTCQANAVILVTDGAPENDMKANTPIKALPDDGATSITQGTSSGQFEASPGIPYGPPDPASTATSPDNYVLLDELAFYMANADARADLAGYQTVKLSTVGFGVNSPILEKSATAGGGHNYSASNAADLKAALEAAILSVSQWLPMASTPATTFNQTTGTSGDVYIAAFSPNSNISWPGTIKKYQYGFGTTTCGDASCGNPDICLTGRAGVTYGTCGNNVEYVDTDTVLGVSLRKIRNEAVSLWIPATPADGGFGTKGGTGQVLIGQGDPANTTRTPDTRNLYTFLTGGTSTQTALTAAGNAIKDTNVLITNTLLGDPLMTAARRSQLIAYAQGSDGTNVSSWRSWPHYDSVHAVPTVDTGDGATLYYLTSDGVVHAVNTADGVERWAFMVEEGLPKIADLQANLAGDHLEVADGNPVQVVTADNKHLLVFGMRRGGSAYYALDVTNPSAPAFAWKITPSQICVGLTCSGSAAYAELGQAWSTPAVGLVRGYKDGGSPAKFKPVLFFGGGYDTNQDSASPGADTVGRAVFVADAASGSLIKKFSTVIGTAGYSVPADVLAVDATGDAAGTIDRLYVGDMGGNLWRMDVDDRTISNSPANWSIVLLAKLATSTRLNKLFNQPTMAASTYKGQSFDAIFVGGGDTQRPTANGANDSGAFFMVKDLAVAGVATQASPVPNAATSGDFVDMTSNVAADVLNTVTGVSASGSTLGEDLLAAKGYVINLNNGEKVTSPAQVLAGNLYFGTYMPRQSASLAENATQCLQGGYGLQYLTDAVTGVPVRDATGTLLYSAGNGRVYANRNGFGSGVGVLGGGGSGSGSGGGGGGGGSGSGGTGCAGARSGNVGLPNQAIASCGVRVFWYSVPEH